VVRLHGICHVGMPAPTNDVRVIVAMSVQAATACIFALLTVRSPGPADRGVLVVVVTTASFLMLVGSLGTGTSGRVLLNAAPPLRVTRFVETAHRLSMVHVLTAAIDDDARARVRPRLLPYSIEALLSAHEDLYDQLLTRGGQG
jgi:hypothetical protein